MIKKSPGLKVKVLSIGKHKSDPSLNEDGYVITKNNTYANPLTGEESFVNTQTPHATVLERSYGACRVQMCESGWYDRNGSFADGCESNTP